APLIVSRRRGSLVGQVGNGALVCRGIGRLAPLSFTSIPPVETPTSGGGRSPIPPLYGDGVLRSPQGEGRRVGKCGSSHTAGVLPQGSPPSSRCARRHPPRREATRFLRTGFRRPG